ncbi:MAG: adenosylcobinamide-GDP ribazoletransferase [Gammaproteobacteria bacterium]
MPDGLRLALLLLTRIPAPHARDHGPVVQGWSLAYYPLVGVLIGWALAAVPLAATLGLNPVAPVVLAAITLVLWVLLTGALHLDGLADSADAWLGGHGDRARSLAIMKDPASGPAGVTALVLVLLLKFAALSALLGGSGYWTAAWTLVWVPAMARSAAAVLLITTPYARPGGMGDAAARHAPRVAVWLGLVLVVCGAWGFGAGGVWVLLCCLVATLALRHIMIRRIAGTTGDTAGALVEILEATALIAIVVGGGAP